MRIAVVSSSVDDAQRLSRAQPGDMQPYFDVHVDGNAVSVSPLDRSDIAHATEAHHYVPTGDLDELYNDVVRPVVVQACTRQANQGCVVLDGSPLARYNALHEERSGLLRMAVAECCAASGVDAVEIGFAEIDVGDAFVDMFDPQSSHPPHVADSNPLACCILTGLSTHDGRDPETLELVESLFNPSRHQVVSVALHHHHHHHRSNGSNIASMTAATTGRSGSASRSASVSAATAAHSTTWLYFVSLAVREAPRPSSSARLGSSALSSGHHERPPQGPFRAALQSVTGCISAPQRPSSVPFSQSKLTHLLKGCLCDELQPCAWIVALMPEGPRFRQKPADAFRDACTSIASARRVASICRAASFPRDLVDFTALSPQSTSDHHHHPHRASTTSSQPRSPSSSSQIQQQNHAQHAGSALQTLAGAGAWLSPTSPGDAALKDAMRDAASEDRRNNSHGTNDNGVAAALRFGSGRGGPASPPTAAAAANHLASFEHSRQPSVSPRPAEQSAPQPTPLDPAVHQQQQQEQQRLVRELDRSEIRAESLQRRLDEARERTRGAEDEVEDLRKQLRAKHNANHDELAGRDETISRLERENDSLRNRLEQQADDARHEADQAIHRLRKQLQTEAAKRAQAERTAEVASETAQEATRRANEAEQLARAHAAKASEAASSSSAKKREASTAASHASAEARAVSMQFATYRGAMEPTLRRLRADAEKLDAALADATKQLRNKDRAIARMQTDLDTAQEQIAAFGDGADARRQRRHNHDESDDDEQQQKTRSADLRAAMAEIQRYQEEVADLTDEVGELQKANGDLATSVEHEVTARNAKDDIIDGLRLELKSTQQHLADARNDATRASIAADNNNYGGGLRVSTASASVQTRVGRADFERMADIEAVLGTEAQMQARRIKQLEAELDSLQSLGGATDAKRTANERRLLDEQLALQQRVADLESDLRAVKQDERSARADATTTAMEVEELRNKLRNLQQPQRANSSVQAGTAGAALDSSHHQHDMESRAAAARTGQPLHHTHHRSTGLRSPGDDSGAEAAPRPTSSRARSSSPSAHQSRRGRSRSGGRSDASGGGITGNFAFRPEELNRVMDMVAKEKSARDHSRSATPQP